MCSATAPSRSTEPAGAPAPPADGALGAPLGLYLHIPFCQRKCPYCDFNTYAGLESIFQAYVEALCRDMARWSAAVGFRRITTVFIGGGTPTVLPTPLLERLLTALRRSFRLVDGAEISCEANPGAVDRLQFAALRDLGVNRLSLGVQSFQPDELRFLGRVHGVEDVLRAVEAARAAGFENINLDFIFGLPDQTPARWAATLEQALAVAPEHLSLYSLIVEPGTPLHDWVTSGQVTPASEDEAAALYELAVARLAAAGYEHYEVSNWARDGGAVARAAVPAYACRHNLIYWRNEEYLGLGPGAHGHLRVTAADGSQVSQRWSILRSVPDYIRRLQEDGPVEAEREVVADRLSMAETMMLGLRLVVEGVSRERFGRLHGRDPGDVFAAELAELQHWGLIECRPQRLRLTPRGLRVANSVCAAFMPEPG
jgi:oxygen-independent coproporphyrinogen-3 oxidase